MDDDITKNEELQPVSEKKNNDTGSTPSYTTSEKPQVNATLHSFLKILLFVFSAAASLVLVFLFIVFLVPVLQQIASKQKTAIVLNEELRQDPAYKKQITQMSKDIQRMTTKYKAYTSGQSYIVINTIENKFLLYKNKKLIRNGFCSSGSYTKLQTGNKHWVFKTPRGKYTVLGKKTNPVWKRPDWSFVEEGLPIPSANAEARFEYGVLGDYALSLGDGYMIHGTIYKRFLGMPVTHGCVRLNDEDLEAVYTTLNIGSKVYIF
jgi:hypothetical protein